MRASVSRNAAYNIIGAVIPLLLSLVTIPAYLHLIGDERYGVLILAWIFLGYFGVFDLGLGRATTQQIGALRDSPAEERATVFWSALMLNPIIGVVGGVILYLITDWYFSDMLKVSASLRDEVLASAFYLAFAVPVATITGTLAGALQGRELFGLTNRISVLSTALFQIVPILVAYFHGPYLPLLLSAAIGARLLGAAWLAWECWREFGRNTPIKVDRAKLSGLLAFGGWVTATSLIAPILVVTDRFLIGNILGAVALAHFSIPYQFAQRISVIPSAITNALFPRLSGATKADEERLSSDASRIICAILLPCLVAGIFILPPFISLWVGQEIGTAVAPFTALLIIAFWANALALVPFTQMQAAAKPQRIVYALLIEVPIYVVAIYWMTTEFGLGGAAAALLLRFLIDLLLLRKFAGSGLLPPAYMVVSAAILGVAAGAQVFGDRSLWVQAAMALPLGALATACAWNMLPQNQRDTIKHSLLARRKSPKL